MGSIGSRHGEMKVICPPKTILHIASALTAPSENTRQQPTDKAHIASRDERVRSQRTSSCGASHKVVICKADQSAACGKKNRLKPFFDFFFHLTFLLLNIPLHSEQQLPHRLQQLRPAVMPLCGHPQRRTHRGCWCGYSHLQ